MEQQDLELKRYIGLLWRGKWLILLTTLIALGGVVAFARQQPTPERSYQATATVLVEPREAPPGVGTAAPLSGADRSLNTQVLLINSRNVMERALAKLDANEGIESDSYSESQVNALQSFITVRPVLVSNLLEIQARAATAELAAQRANAMVEAYMDYVKAERIKAIEDALMEISSQLHGSDTPGQLSARAAVLLPQLGSELEQAGLIVEKSVQNLERLRNGAGTSDREPSLSVEAPLLESMARELEGISEELQNIQARLLHQDPQGDLLLLNREAPRIDRLVTDLISLSEEPLQSRQQNLQLLRSLLELEVAQLNGAISDLTSASQQLDRLQSRLQASASPQMLGGVISGLDNVEANLREISKELSQVHTNSLETATQLAAARNYVDSVADYLETTAGRLENPPANSPALDQAQITSIQNQILGRVRGMELATSDVANIRNPNLSSNSRVQLYTAEGRLRSARDQLNAVATELAGKAGNTSLQASLTQVKDQIDEGNRGLKAISEHLESLDSAMDIQAGRDAANQVSMEANDVALSVDIAIRLLSIQSLHTDPAIEAQLKALERQLLDAQSKVEGIHQRLTALAQGNDTSVADNMVIIRGQVRTSAKSLMNIRQELQALDRGGKSPSEVLAKAQLETANVAYSLDIAVQQIQSILGPLTADELGPLADRLSSAQRSARGISDRLSSDAQAADIALADSLGLIEMRVRESANNLLTTLENLDVNSPLLSARPDTDAALQVYTSANNASLSLDTASRQFTGLVNGINDPLLRGELSSLADRLARAWDKSKGISQLLEATLGVGNTTEPRGEVALVQNRLASSAAILKAAATAHEQLPGALNDQILRDLIAGAKEQADIGSAILQRATDDLDRIQINEMDPTRYGQLVVVEERVRDALARVTVISSQLRQLLGRTGPGYEQLLQLHQQLELSRLSPQEIGITLVDSAVVREAASASVSDSVLSRNRFRLPLAGIAGILLGVLAVFFREQVDQRVRTQKDLRDRVGLVPLGVIPRGKAANGQLPMASSQGHSMFSEAVQLVGTALESSLDQGACYAVITSVRAREGKTVAAINLAHVLANHGHRVLLVDGNLRKPDVAAALNLPEVGGLSQALELGRDPAAFIVEAGVSNEYPFSVLPAGKPAANPAKLLASSEMKVFLQHVKQQYDVVLVDCPPQVGFAETKALAKELGSAILVVKAGAINVDAIKESKDDLESAGVAVVGAVINFAPAGECAHLKHDSYGSRNERGLGFLTGKRSMPCAQEAEESKLLTPEERQGFPVDGRRKAPKL